MATMTTKEIMQPFHEKFTTKSNDYLKAFYEYNYNKSELIKNKMQDAEFAMDEAKKEFENAIIKVRKMIMRNELES